MSEELPAGYVESVQRMILLSLAWVQRHPRAVLRWKTWGDTAYTAALSNREAMGWLADSRDAHKLLEWLDRRTRRQCSLMQACAALELAGIKPNETRTGAAPAPSSEVN